MRVQSPAVRNLLVRMAGVQSGQIPGEIAGELQAVMNVGRQEAFDMQAEQQLVPWIVHGTRLAGGVGFFGQCMINAPTGGGHLIVVNGLLIGAAVASLGRTVLADGNLNIGGVADTVVNRDFRLTPRVGGSPPGLGTVVGLNMVNAVAPVGVIIHRNGYEGEMRSALPAPVLLRADTFGGVRFDALIFQLETANAEIRYTAWGYTVPARDLTL